MHIFFIGQQGIPARNSGDGPEKRVQALSSLLNRRGYSVTVACERGYTPAILRSAGIAHLYRSRRFFPAFLGILWQIWRQRPDVVHIQNWKAARWIRLAVLLSPDTTYVWTVSQTPHSWLKARLIAWQAHKAFDSITVPERHLQYLLLTEIGLRSTYIPDGYAASHLPLIPASNWKLRKNQYALTTATTRQEVEWIATAYKQIKTRKKLVVTGEIADFKALRRKYPFLVNIPSAHSRAITSLIQQAVVVIATTASDQLLQAMHAERTIVATANPAIEEVVGTTADIVAQGDRDALHELLTKALKSTGKSSLRSKKAATRAKAHFQWDRIFDEYSALYHYPATKRIPMDSVLPRRRTTVAA